MHKSRRLLGVTCLCASFAVAQARAEDPPWDRPEARTEAKRVLEVGAHLLRRTEQRDARPAAEALTDASPLLRLLALERLRVLGLAKERLQALGPGAAAAEPPKEHAPAVVAAREFAEALPVAAHAPPKLGPSETLKAVLAATLDRLERGGEAAARKRELFLSLLAFRAVVPAADRAWLAEALGGLVEEERIARELSAEDLAAACKEDGAPVTRWLAENARFLAWSPRVRRFVVDVEARSVGKPTDEHRKGQRWPD